MIYTVTFNPALDYILTVPPIEAGEVNRASAARLIYGGKGINVSVILRQLGVESTALGFAAGFTGDELEKLAAEAGVRTDFVRLSHGQTRINVKLWGADGRVTEVNAPGPTIDQGALDEFYRKLDHLQEGDTLVLAGSVPAGLPADLYRDILARLADRGIRTVVDASGDLLRRVLIYRPFLIKPNRSELEELMGHPLPDDAALESAARTLQSEGAQNVLISLGGDGALLLDADGAIHREAALSRSVGYTVGAGDSMVAGFLAGIVLGGGYRYALHLGSAAGGATAASDSLATADQIRALCKLPSPQ